jgi:signal transduction histidine kinase
VAGFDRTIPPAPPSHWKTLLRLRWPLGGAIGLAFALGRLAEIVLLELPHDALRTGLDGLAWGLLGGAAVWLTLTWAGQQERKYQAGLEQALNDQRRANSHLALLSEVNRHIADSATLDAILDAALDFPRRLVEVRAAALLLSDSSSAVEARREGASAADLARWRAAFGVRVPEIDQRQPRLLRSGSTGMPAACLVLPLHDGMAPLGWVELYLERAGPVAAEELALLETIATEIAEAVASARRRSREERAIYELERAIAEERARIARDIHDGIAQDLAFMRMRVDLWKDWIATDPQRLREELTGLKGTLREQIRELRRAIFALRPIQFDELGFAGGLRRYVVEFAGQHGWDARADLGDLPPALPPEVEAICFRIVQEALTNVAKHAAATRVEVTLDQADQGLRIVVRDNGRGFDPGRLGDTPDHVGLRQMRERVSAFRGQLTLLSRPASGTELRAWIPLAVAEPRAALTRDEGLRVKG